MVHTNPEIETSNLILDFEFDQHLGSHKHVINIIMWFRDMGCYNDALGVAPIPAALPPPHVPLGSHALAAAGGPTTPGTEVGISTASLGG
jgi:hypothetical protein